MGLSTDSAPKTEDDDLWRCKIFFGSKQPITDLENEIKIEIQKRANILFVEFPDNSSKGSLAARNKKSSRKLTLFPILPAPNQTLHHSYSQTSIFHVI